jgi:hypothetical protein
MKQLLTEFEAGLERVSRLALFLVDSKVDETPDGNVAELLEALTDLQDLIERKWADVEEED